MRGRKPRYLLSGAAISLLGYALLAVLTAHQMLADVDLEVRTWVALLRHEFLNLPMRAVTAAGTSGADASSVPNSARSRRTRSRAASMSAAAGSARTRWRSAAATS